MDDLEFRTRAYSNPRDDRADFISAVATDPSRQQLVAELRALDDELLASVSTIKIPDGLRQRLLEQALGDTTPTSTAGDSPAANQPWWRFRSRGAYALAASLVITAGLGLSLLPNRPSAQDLEFHDELVEHLHSEAPSFSSSDAIAWEQVERVLTDAGASLVMDDATRALHMTFANYCGLGGAQHGAHLVARGEHGPVSIIFVDNTPVSTRVNLKDERFQGRIIPLSQGNIAVIGEKNESLDYYEQLMVSHLHWSI